MMPVLTVSQMRAIDEQAILSNISVGYSYMMKAGMELFSVAHQMVNDRKTGDIAILCGKGNNGGDGYVAGRLLLEAGYGVMCFGLCEGEELENEAKKAYDEYIEKSGNFCHLDDIELLENIHTYALIIDAMLGTGIKGNPRAFYADVIRKINQSGVRILAVDTPSGLNNDTGIPSSPCINATATVTMGFPKIGAYFYPGKSSVGTLFIKELGYPEKIVAANHDNIFIPEFGDLKGALPPRKPDGSKFDHGCAMMVCGSKGMTGSATLACLAAIRTGCGMVHCATPHSALPVLSSKLTETVMHSIDETSRGTPSYNALSQLLDLAEKNDSICIGPGISHDNETTQLVKEFVKKAGKPMILDADGINAFKGAAEHLKEINAEIILTPHKGEWARLFGSLPEQPLEIIASLKQKASEYNCTILLKGNPTLVADPQANIYILPYGNSGMATAGSGDVLSGIIASLLAQGCKTTDAAILGAFIQGIAGDFAREKRGEYSMIAGDLIDSIYKVMNILTE
ncbi:MAG: NAD(P)H-hydrate dehydratase [Chitinivibrionales bacterium]|nr:NAD(P)H-hydrate dehydratase [Chitinivibrionales bacterium]